MVADIVLGAMDEFPVQKTVPIVVDSEADEFPSHYNSVLSTFVHTREFLIDKTWRNLTIQHGTELWWSVGGALSTNFRLKLATIYGV